MQDDELLKKIAYNIKKARLKTGLTQEQFAEKIDKSWSYVSKIESGKNNFTLTSLNKISDYLSIQVDELLRID